MRRTSIVLATVTALLAVGMVPAALAARGKPVERMTFEINTPAETSEFLSDECGFEVEEAFEATVRRTYYEDGYVAVHLRTRATIHSPETGQTVYRTASGSSYGRETEEEDEVAETLTITIDNRINGMTARYLKKGGGVLLVDAGRVVEQGSIVLDISGEDEEVISEDVTLTVRGPHTEEDTDIVAMLCEARRPETDAQRQDEGPRVEVPGAPRRVRDP